MDLLVTLFLQITLRTDPCVIPKIEATCAEYRLPAYRNEIVWVCEADYKKVTYEVMLRERSDGTWRLAEMWEGDRPYYGEPYGLWNNIYDKKITAIGKPAYCEVPILNNQRHE